jgi:hypothetical protein
VAAKPDKALRGPARPAVGKNQRPDARGNSAAYPVRLPRIKKRVVGAAVGEIPAKFFETLVVIGFALRYHSKRRTAGRLSGIPDGRPRGPGFGAVPSASPIDGTVRARIIGAFALFVST